MLHDRISHVAFRRAARRPLRVLVIAALLAGGFGCDYIGARTAQKTEPAPAEASRSGASKAAAPSASPDAPKGGATAGAGKAEMHVQQGISFGAMKDWDNAIQEFSKAIDVDANHTPAYANRAVAYMQQRKYNKAMDDLKRAESIDARDKMVHYNLVALHSLQNQTDRALDSLDRALQLGFADYDALRSDPDLNNVRRHAEFRKVLEKHKVFIR